MGTRHPTTSAGSHARRPTTANGERGAAAIGAPAAYKKNTIEPGAQLRVSSWGDSSEQKVVSDALARFNQVYPDVKITYEPQPSDYGTKLLAQISSNTQPDVFYLDVDLPYQLIPNNVLLDLTPALTEVGRSKDDYFSSLTGVFLGKDGKVYGLPKDFTSMALFYNTDMVKTPPKPGWTQDDFTAWVKENTTGSGQTRVFGFASDPCFSPTGATSPSRTAPRSSTTASVPSTVPRESLPWTGFMACTGISSSRSPPTSAPPGRVKPSPGSERPASSWAAGSIPS